MITNPSCPNDVKSEPDQKFHAQNFEPEEQDFNSSCDGSQVGPNQLTDLSGYNHNHAGHMMQQQQYNGQYAQYGQWQQQGYDYYQQGYYQGYQPHQMYQQHDQWAGHQQGQQGQHQAMVLPPGPSPTGSNNSPSPHGFTENNDEHLPHRAELKRHSPDTFVPHNVHVIPPHHQPPAAKKPKVSKRRKKRDPNEPQKPVSAYALFFRDTQANIKIRNPTANFGEVSKIVAATWDSLDPDAKAAYKKRTEMAKKEYLRALAAYRANMVSKGPGHEMYGGFPGFAPMMNNTSMEQAMPATGMMGQQGQQPMTMPMHTQYNGSYHPGYMQMHPSHQQQQLHPGHPQHSPGAETHSSQANQSPKLEDQLGSEASFSPEAPNPQYPGPPPGQFPPKNLAEYTPSGNGKCGRPGCRNFTPGQTEFCSSECVVGECKDVYSSWSSCMMKGSGGADPPRDLLVK